MRFCYCQSNVRRLLPASDYCRERGNQIVEHSSDNETLLAVVVSWGEQPNIWLTLANNAFVGWAVRMLLKGAVTIKGCQSLDNVVSEAFWANWLIGPELKWQSR